MFVAADAAELFSAISRPEPTQLRKTKSRFARLPATPPDVRVRVLNAASISRIPAAANPES